MELVEINIAGRVHSVRPCPFCGGSDLLPGLWSLENGEEDSIECSTCLAGAPLTAWLKPNVSDEAAA